MSRLWWTHLSSSQRMLSGAINTLGKGKNLILIVPPDAPWPEEFRGELTNLLERDFCDKSVQYIDFDGKANAVSEFENCVLEKFCKKELRDTYRPSIGVGTFLGRCKELTLGDSIVWAKPSSEEELCLWLSFVNDYRKTVSKDVDYGLFILEVKNLADPSNSSNLFSQLNLKQEIPEYQIYSFATVLCYDSGVKENWISYLSTLLSSCCNDVELIPLIIERYTDFMRNPYSTIKSIANVKYKSDGSKFFIEDTEETLANKVWEAQIKVLFPYIEKYRVYILDKLMRQIKDNIKFPIKGSCIEKEEPLDLELGDLLLFIGRRIIIMNDSREYARLGLFHTVRNSLAHMRPVDFEQIKLILNNPF